MKKIIAISSLVALMCSMSVGVASNNLDKHGGFEVSKTNKHEMSVEFNSPVMVIENYDHLGFCPEFDLPENITFNMVFSKYFVPEKIGKVINKPLTRNSGNVGYYWTSGENIVL